MVTALESRRGNAGLGGLRPIVLRTNGKDYSTAEATTMPQLANVNTTDIRAAIELGCRCMGRVFNADDNNIPFFVSEVRPNPHLGFSGSFSEAHVPGRHLNALLNAEDVLGVAIPDEVIEKHAAAAFFSYSGPVTLPLNRERIGGPLASYSPHNVREGFHALYALVKFRGSERAQELAEASIATILDLWNPDTGWDWARLAALGVQRQWDDTFLIGLARAIGPLVKYYRATGYGPALDLALLLKDKAISEFFTADGHYDRDAFGTHVHSTTCVLSSLAQLADLTHDASLMARVKAFYDNGLWEVRDAIGWSLENSRDDAHPDLGECNNTGDILETALLLGKWGYTEGYADAELILHAHLLPAQLRDNSFITDPPNPNNEDGLRNIADRHLGAFGFPTPYGHAPVGSERLSFNMDIVGGTVGSICEALREVVRSDRTGHHVNLLFDCETPELTIQSPYTHGALSITVHEPAPLWVRLPSWVSLSELCVEGFDLPLRLTNGYLLIPQPPVDGKLTLRFPLSEREIVLKHRTRNIRLHLRGDEVIAMDNFGADLTYFPPLT